MLENLLGWLRTWDPTPALETRAIDSFEDAPGLTEQLLAVQGLRTVPFRQLGIREILEIPAQWRAVNLIAGLVGSFGMLAYRDGARLEPTPPRIARPDPFTDPREFYGGSAWNFATRGEFIWYHAALDLNERPLSLLNLPLAEVHVDWADDSHIQKTYRWRDRQLKPSRVTHKMKSLEPGALRGMGPLQMCGAALSAAAEADQWAARYFSEGGLTAVHLHSEAKLSDAEADAIRSRWIERRGTVRVTSGGVVQTTDVGVSAEDAQLLSARLHSRGDAAVMWGIPAKLLEYTESGSSLTYQNVGDVMTEFIRQELAPGYIEPIEQAMSDLQPRSIVTRMETRAVQRADPETRWGIHKIATEIGAYDAAYVRTDEGIEIDGANPDLEPIPTGADVAARMA